MPQLEAQDASIPVIDISNPSSEVAQQVLDAASTHGFLFLKNDGVIIPPRDIEEMFTLSSQFFSQPREQKSEFAIHSEKAGGKNRGWVQMQGESLDPEGQKKGDPKEAFNIAEPYPTLQPLPPAFASSTPLISRFQNSCHDLCKKIFDFLGTALNIPSSNGGQSWFSDRHDRTRGSSGTIFRMLYYPKTSAPTNGVSIRAGAHSDYGSVTLLFRLPGQPGLEILKEDGSWAPVPVNPYPSTLKDPPILVNIGDLLSFWTNGMLKSTVHRVTFNGGGEERYSMAYFCHPLDDTLLEAVPSQVIEDFGDKGVATLNSQRKRLGLDCEKGGGGEVLTAGGHLARRLQVTYGLKD